MSGFFFSLTKLKCFHIFKIVKIWKIINYLINKFNMMGIYLGLGTNQNNREVNLSRCVNQLSDNGDIKVVGFSSVYETEPYGYPDQPRFLNMVVEIKTQLTPLKLLSLMQNIEKKLGRKKTFRWGPRVIDIDILSYRNRVINHPDLTVPHKQMHLRKFVLIPLKEVAGNFIHSESQKNINQLLSECRDKSQVTLIMNGNSLFS